MLGYFIFVGLPVSYCTSLVPPFQFIDHYSAGTGTVGFSVAAPSVDGTYSSASNCGTMYGRDATTGAYIEYTTGFGINAFVSDQPLPWQNEEALTALGWATFEDVQQ